MAAHVRGNERFTIGKLNKNRIESLWITIFIKKNIRKLVSTLTFRNRQLLTRAKKHSKTRDEISHIQTKLWLDPFENLFFPRKTRRPPTHAANQRTPRILSPELKKKRESTSPIFKIATHIVAHRANFACLTYCSSSCNRGYFDRNRSCSYGRERVETSFDRFP